MTELIRNIEHAKDFKLTDLVEIEQGKVNSISLSQTPGTR